MMNARGVLTLKRSARLLGKLSAVVLCACFITLLSAFLTSFYSYHRAQQLLLAVQTLEPGKTTVEDIQKLVKHFGGAEYDARGYYTDENGNRKPLYDPCSGDGSTTSYSINVNPPLALVRAVMAFPALQKLGLHPWMVAVGIQHKDGRVTCYSERILFYRRDEHVIEGNAEVRKRNPQSLIEEEPYKADSFVARHSIHQTRVDVLTEAPEGQRRRAFQMQLACVVSPRGCDFPCQILPLGWLDSVRDRQAHGRVLPEGADDSRCPPH